MEIKSRTPESIVVLELKGRFDAFAVPDVKQWFDSQPKTNKIVVNMEGVHFIDSSGLSSLVKGLKQSRLNGGDLVLCGMQQAVKIIFELTRLDKAFDIYEDEKAAVAALGA